MPRRTRYSPGTPCWADCITPDLTGSQSFYAELFGWEYVPETPGYQLAVLRGEIVGGFGAAPTGTPPRAAWNVYLATKDAEHTCALVGLAGGRVVMPPVPAGDNGRLFLAVDPAGAAVGFWEGHRAEGVVVADEPGAVSGHELRVPDATRAAAFYGDLFGHRTAPGEEELHLDGAPVARLTEGDAGRPLWLPHFGTADPADTARLAVELGAEPVRPADGRPGLPALLRDPWGAEFGLVQA
ncbi:VOC family protein [Kitasatospora sp. NPDC093679]|uniref:VOC family protein n=1 Tax=Kitasatospora sp. NPDC093679 TaxID=3154983 RepID=UPI00342EDA14